MNQSVKLTVYLQYIQCVALTNCVHVHPHDCSNEGSIGVSILQQACPVALGSNRVVGPVHPWWQLSSVEAIILPY